MLVVEELYREAVVNRARKLIIFNGELDRIRSGCILLPACFLQFFYLFKSHDLQMFDPLSVHLDNYIC